MRHLADIKADLLAALLPEVIPTDVHRARQTLGFAWARRRWGTLAQMVRVSYQLGYVLSRRPRAKVEWFGQARGIAVLKLGDEYAEWLLVLGGPEYGALGRDAVLAAMPGRDPGDPWVYRSAAEWEEWAEHHGYAPRWGSLLTLDGETA